MIYLTQLLVLICSTFILINRLDAQLVESWVARYHAENLDRANAIAVDDSGNVFVTGASGMFFDLTDYATIKYNSSGDTQWVRRYDGFMGHDEAFDLALNGTGNVVVTGSSDNGGFDYGYVTILYNSMGETLWVRRQGFLSQFNGTAKAVAFDLLGNIVVSGVSPESSPDYLTLQYNISGDSLWAIRYNGLGNGNDGASDLVVDGSGNIYVTGWSWGGGTDFDYATVKYDNNGNQLWSSRYNGPASGPDSAFSIALDDSGNVLVTGSSLGLGTNHDYATIKYSDSGSLLWERRYNGPGNGLDAARALAIDDSGNIYITGESESDFLTIAYDLNGDTIWVARYDGTGNGSDGATAIALDDSGYAYVSGGSTGIGSGLDYTTIKYNGNGDTIWVARYDGTASGSDQARALALDPAGSVYVTGSSEGSGTGLDYVTIKYSSPFHDGGVISIDEPRDTVFTDSTYIPIVTIRNFGTFTETFNVICNINGFSDTFPIFNLASGVDTQVSFNPWIVPPTDSIIYSMIICTEVANDADTSNDCMMKQIFAYTPVGIVESPPIPSPNVTFLYPAIPNPFRHSTQFRFSLANPCYTSLKLYDLSGRLVRTLMESELKPGKYWMEWKGKDQVSGVYFFRLQAGDFSQTRKMILLR